MKRTPHTRNKSFLFPLFLVLVIGVVLLGVFIRSTKESEIIVTTAIIENTGVDIYNKNLSNLSIASLIDSISSTPRSSLREISRRIAEDGTVTYFNEFTPRIGSFPELVEQGGLSSIFNQFDLNILQKLYQVESQTAEIKDIDIPAYTREHASTINFKRKDGTIATIHACDEERIVTTELFGNTVSIHEEILPYVRAINETWKQRGGSAFYFVPDSDDGLSAVSGYTCRLISKSRRASGHAYGLSIDINSNANPYVLYVKEFDKLHGLPLYVGETPVMYRPPTVWVRTQDKSLFKENRDYYTDMPDSFIELFDEQGFGWGGQWESKLDAMHFSALCNEGGTLADCDV